jgi:hypothetical protein
MKHSSIRELFEYWNERRGLRPAPERGDIEPGAIRRILADTFMLAFNERAGHPFRIAGTRVCAAFGRELKGEGFVDLWAAENQDLIRDILAIVAQETIGVVLSAGGQRVTDKDAAGGTLDLEVLILPLNHRGRTNARVVGALAPVETPYWLGTSALGPLTLRTHRYLDPGLTTQEPHPRRAQSLGHIRRGLVVYDGGQF